MRCIVALALLATTPAAADPGVGVGASIDEQWSARAGVALQRFDGLQKRLASGGKDAKDAKCEALIEIAYQAHISNKEVAQTRSGAGVAYHLIVNGGAAGLLDVGYFFKTGDQRPTMVVYSLPKEWKIIALDVGMLTVVMADSVVDRCGFNFIANKPFDAFASTI